MPDQVPAGKQRLRGGADPIALGHAIRRGFGGRCELGVVQPQPQSLGALEIRDEAGFGEAHGSGVRYGWELDWAMRRGDPRADSNGFKHTAAVAHRVIPHGATLGNPQST